MGTLDKKIWHTAKEKPHDNENVVVLGPMGFDAFRWLVQEDRQHRYFYENWYRWAYLDDVILSGLYTAKATNQSRAVLKNLKKAFEQVAEQTSDVPNRIRHSQYADLVQVYTDKAFSVDRPRVMDIVREYMPDSKKNER